MKNSCTCSSSPRMSITTGGDTVHHTNEDWNSTAPGHATGVVALFWCHYFYSLKVGQKCMTCLITPVRSPAICIWKGTLPMGLNVKACFCLLDLLQSRQSSRWIKAVCLWQSGQLLAKVAMVVVQFQIWVSAEESLSCNCMPSSCWTRYGKQHVQIGQRNRKGFCETTEES